MPRGGSRPGAGRPAGSENRDTAAMRAALSELASEHVEVALGALANIARSGQSEGARVSAACAILDRVYGRPRQALQHEGDGGALAVNRVVIEPALAVDWSQAPDEVLEWVAAQGEQQHVGSSHAREKHIP